jgi:hypothetical protein
LIPKEFIFKAYKSFTYKVFREPNSFKPKSIEELKANLHPSILKKYQDENK